VAVIEVNGRRIEVDDSFLSLPPEQQEAEVDAIAAQAAPPQPNLSPAGEDVAGLIDSIFPTDSTVVEAPPPSAVDRALGGLAPAAEFVGDLGTGVARGLAAVAGAPVDLINASPMLLNLLPGEQGMTPLTDRPVGGSADMEALFNLPAAGINAVAGTDFDVFNEPQNMAGRFADRVGQEVGATVPFLGAGARLASGGRALSEMSPVGRHLAAPMRVDPAGAARREVAYATSAGTGAQTANELFTLDNQGTPYSDIGGSVAGVAGHASLAGLLGAGKTALAAISGKPGFMDDVAGKAIVDQIINNSGMMHRQAEPFVLRGKQPQLDTTPLAEQLRTPAEVERLVPGYTADIGARSGDPMLQTYAQDANSRVPGAGNTARVANNAAVNEAVGQMAPQGDPAKFRLDLQGGVDEQINALLSAEMDAQNAATAARGAVAPQMAGPTARGTEIRAGAQGAKDTRLDANREMYRAIEDSDAHIDPAVLAERFGAVDAGLARNDQLRFRPREADTPGLLGDEGPVPFREATAIRSGLSNDMMAARAKGEPRQASIAGQYRDELDQYLTEALDPETAAAYSAANRDRFDIGERFEEGNTAIAQALKRTERGNYVLDASALPRKFVQPDTGKISDYQGLMREAGDQPGVRDAIADQVLEDAQPFLDKPERLRAFLSERNVVLSDFPEVRQRLEAAGVATEGLAEATTRRTGKERDLTTPGRSPEADYLYQRQGQAFGNDESRRSVARLVNAADPRAATRQLLDTAGGTPKAAVNLRTAFWEEVQGHGINSATDSKGQKMWNARAVLDKFNDPKFSAVAEELWRDNPEDLKAIRDVFTAIDAAAPGKSRAPGSSGTPQAIAGTGQQAITSRRIVSDVRSLSRGAMSLPVATVGLATNWLAKKSAQVQSGAIQTLAAQVVNNPGLAADLLEKFNPADYAARRQMLTQKYGARVGNLLEMIAPDSEDDEDEEMKGAIEDGR
jgi:hypothetical protein